jgi:hypothetical protein
MHRKVVSDETQRPVFVLACRNLPAALAGRHLLADRVQRCTPYGLA